MQISPIKLYTYKPVFTSVNTTNPLTPLKCDKFERISKEPNIEEKFELYYETLEKDMGILNEDDIKLMIDRVHKKVPEASKKEILYTMGILSQYSSYKCWKHLKENFEQLKINSIEENPGYSYIINKTVGKPVCLTSVMSYLFNKNCSDLRKSYEGQDAIILDSNLISLMGKRDFENLDNYLLIYIENFENGYNFLNQGEDFEDFTARIIKNAKKYDNFKQGVHKILNGENLSRLNALGIKPVIIKYDEENVTPKVIADRLNPIIISKDDYKTIINKILKPSKYDYANIFERILKPFKSSKKSPNNTLEFMQTMNVFVTPKQFAKNLKIMHEQINECAKENGFENLYYLIPNYRKSFGLINYMFQKVNNIPDEKFVYYDLNSFKKSYPKMFDFLPKNSTFVVLDDCCISGESLKEEQLFYKYFMKKNSNYFHDKKINFIIAPMYSTVFGKEKLKKIKSDNHKAVIAPFQMLPEIPRKLENEVNFSIINDTYHNRTVTSLVFPYMGPDSNNPKFLNLYEKMLFSPDAQKIL